MKKEYLYIPLFLFISIIWDYIITLFFRNKLYYNVASLLILFFVGVFIGVEINIYNDTKKSTARINKTRLFSVVIPLVILNGLLLIPYILQYLNIISSSQFPYFINNIINVTVLKESSAVLLGYFIATLKKQ